MNYLFRTANLLETLEFRKNNILRVAEEYDRDVIQGETIEKIVNHLLNMSKLRTPKLRPDLAKILLKSEVKILNNDFGRQIETPGIGIIVSIPFEGNPEYFRLKPSTTTHSHPEGYVVGNEIRREYVFPKDSKDSLQFKHKEHINNIQRYLLWVEKDIEEFNKSIHPLLSDKIKVRKKLLSQMEKTIESSGLANHENEKEALAQSPQEKQFPQTSQYFEYDAFISYASEDESFVKPLAKKLSTKGLNIWYDKFILKVGDNLRKSIDSGLAESRYGIVVFSKDFFRKKWPNYELDGLIAKMTEEKKVILPIWHNITKDDILEYSPSLTNIFALNTNTDFDEIIESLLAILKT